jgi:ATP-dependent RNA helicase RhlE
MSFKSLNLPSYLVQHLQKHHFIKATPVQLEAIPAVFSGKDVLGVAPTGTGKTAGYVLPLLSIFEKKPLNNRHVNALVLVPTRELAVQVDEVLSQFSAGLKTPLKTMAVHGGKSINLQMMKMNRVSILVATPGRLLDLVRNKAVHLDEVKTFVLDEADKLLNLGFQDELNEVLALLPAKRQNLLFSATLNSNIEDLSRLFLDEPQLIEMPDAPVQERLIREYGFRVEQNKKGVLLRELIKRNNFSSVLVFTSSTHQADHVCTKLERNGIKAAAIHGKKSQGARDAALIAFKNGELQVLVATDLLARGVDIKGLPAVINYELPRSPKDYTHRIGRTGRADERGEAFSLVSPEEEQHFRLIQKKAKKWAEMVESTAFLAQE